MAAIRGNDREGFGVYYRVRSTGRIGRAVVQQGNRVRLAGVDFDVIGSVYALHELERVTPRRDQWGRVVRDDRGRMVFA